jgi:hypothetical protein
MKTSSTIPKRIIQGLAIVLGLLGALQLYSGVMLLVSFGFASLILSLVFCVVPGLLMVCVAYSAIFRKRVPKISGVFLLILAFGFVFLITADALYVHRLNDKVSEIQQGDPIDSVISIMGEPDVVYPKGRPTRVLWYKGKAPFKEVVYGSFFNWDSALNTKPPFFQPLKLRIFGPTDDIVIYLDEKDQVVKIKIPGKGIISNRIDPKVKTPVESGKL